MSTRDDRDEEQEGGADLDSLTESARDRLLEKEQVFRLMGMDEATILAMREGMLELYNPETGEFEVDDYESFEEVMLPALMNSQVLEDSLSCTKLLDHPQLKGLWLPATVMRPCIEEFDARLGVLSADMEEECEPVDLLIDDSYEEERVELGELLHEWYMNIVTDAMGARVYEALFEFSKDATDEEEKEMATNAMSIFNVFPREGNTVLQFLFIKSFIAHLELEEEIDQEAEDEEQRAEFVNSMEESLFAVLCQGYDPLEDEESDDDDDDDDEEDEDGEDDEYGYDDDEEEVAF